MTTLLTTQEVQDLLQVDRSTVYRMAEDGRLPSIKVGRQWRFPADRMAAQLGTPAVDQPVGGVGRPITPQSAPVDTNDTDEVISPEIAQAIATLLGDLFGLMAVVTDAAGRPLSEVANPCGLYAAIADEPATADACLAEWRSFAERSQMAQRFAPSHLGFLCARTFLWVERKPVGMLLVGGITPAAWPPSPERIAETASMLGIPAEQLDAVIEQTYDVDADHQRWVLDTLAQFGDLLSMFLGDHLHLRSTLDAITQLAASHLTEPAERTPS